MANTDTSISENRFAVELDGIPAFKASKVTVGEEKNTPVKTMVGNDPYALVAMGNVEVSETTITIPSGLYDTAIRALEAWVNAYFDRINTAPKSGRVITYDNNGRVPIETRELRDCIPVSLKMDDKSADGNNSATVTLTLQPTKVRRI